MPRKSPRRSRRRSARKSLRKSARKSLRKSLRKSVRKSLGKGIRKSQTRARASHNYREYRATETNTFCTWTHGLQNSQIELLKPDGSTVKANEIFSDETRPSTIDDWKTLDLGGGTQGALDRVLATEDGLDVMKHFTQKVQILTGGSIKDRLSKAKEYEKKYPNTKFYCIDPNDEGLLTVLSCQRALRSQVGDDALILVVAKGTKDLHLYMIEKEIETRKDTIKWSSQFHNDKPEELFEQFLDNVRLRGTRIAIVFVAKSAFSKAITGRPKNVEAGKLAMVEVDENKVDEKKNTLFEALVVKKIKERPVEEVTTWVGSRDAS